MNLIILEDHHFVTGDEIVLTGRHHAHIVKIINAQVGDALSLGRLNGNVGKGIIKNINTETVTLEPLGFDQAPPDTLPLTLILGLPRPRMLQRTLQTIATMGVERLCLIQTSRVEKSFWQTPLLNEQTIREQLILGLEQGKATQLPRVECYQRFRPYIEDVLPSDPAPVKLIAHPGAYPYARSVNHRQTTLAVGPEGGFIAGEAAQFEQLGFQPIQLGQRILRVETAVPVLLAKLF